VLTDTVTVNYSIDLRLVSDLVGAPLDELEALNPSLLRGVTPPDASFDLHLPAGAATLFDQRVVAIPEAKRNAWRYHLVAGGDTLASVAHDYHVQPSQLEAVTELGSGGDLQGVEALVIPQAAQRMPSTHRALYTARRGDTLVTIADRFGVSLAELRRWNSLSGTRVEPGSRLHVAEPDTAAHTGRSHSATRNTTASTARANHRARSAGARPAVPASQRKGAAPAAKKPSHSRSRTKNPATKTGSHSQQHKSTEVTNAAAGK
jgi:membrane-bound lytic murein transglycosylase D